MEWKIIKNNDFYFPRTERWVIDTFNLKLDEATFYTMIMNKKYITWTVDWMANVLNSSPSTIKRTLNKFLEMGIVTRCTVSPDGTRKRSVYVALYEDTGKRSDALIENYLNLGLDKIGSEYGEKRFYKRKSSH